MRLKRKLVSFAYFLGTAFYLIALLTALRMMGLIGSEASILPEGSGVSLILPILLVLGVPHILLAILTLKRGGEAKFFGYLVLTAILMILLTPLSVVVAPPSDKLYVADDLGHRYPQGSHWVPSNAKELVVYYNMTEDEDTKYLITVNGTEDERVQLSRRADTGGLPAPQAELLSNLH